MTRKVNNIEHDDYMFVHLWPVEGEDNPDRGVGFGMTVFNSYVDWVNHMQLDCISMPTTPEDLVNNEYRMVKFIHYQDHTKLEPFVFNED
tara:strand:+ start:208 stop:477 length:270 start_codon:yes stop_codon:yes gene_type:complete